LQESDALFLKKLTIQDHNFVLNNRRWKHENPVKATITYALSDPPKEEDAEVRAATATTELNVMV